MRSISLASDGSCLVAGSVKVGREGGALVHNEIDMLIDIARRASATYGRSTTNDPISQDSRLSLCSKLTPSTSRGCF